MPFAFGPWKRTTTTVSPVNSPARNARLTSSWSWNTRTGASITCRSGATAETFITPVPRLPFSRRVPPVGWNGSPTGRRILSFSVSRGALAPDQRPVDDLRLLGVARQPLARDRAGVGMQQPAAKSSPIMKPRPPAAWKWFTSASPLG